MTSSTAGKSGQPAQTGQPTQSAGHRTGWASARREIAVAAGIVVVLAVAAATILGFGTASIVVLFCVALALAALRTLIPTYNHQPPPPDLHESTPTTSFLGFWRTQTDLADSMSSLSYWDFGTRRRLQNLLAARLAERHGISLAADPQKAREIFVGQDTDRGEALWFWIDPDRPTPPDATSRSGIPPRVLTALIHRLEQL